MHLVADVLCLYLPGGALPFVFFAMFAKIQRKMVLDAGVGEEGLQPVIVLLQNRVEFMIVTARACECKAKECPADGIGDVVKNLLAAFHELSRIAFVGKMAVETGGDESGRIARIQFVTGDLLLHKPVGWFVAVEGIDDVIAVPPDIGSRLIALEAFAIGVPRQIQPVARPAFAVARGVEQAVYYFCKRFG